jgi:hypothetical protein
MKQKIDRIAETLTVAGLAILSLYATCWAGPPPPPSIPATPVGGTEISIATAVAIAGYGYWKSRK